MSTLFVLLFVFVVLFVLFVLCSFSFFVASVLGPEPLNNRGIGRFRHLFPVLSGILTEVTSDKLP